MTYVAYVQATSGSGSFTGKVTFYENGVAVPGCQNESLFFGFAYCTLSFANAGSVSVTATYANDPKFTGSTDSSTQVVNKGNTSVSLGHTSSITFGGHVNYSATVTATSGSGALGGTVTFTDNGVNITGCINLPVGGGTVSCSVTFPSAGSFAIKATYSGSSNFNGSSTSVSQTVNKGTTSLSLSPSSTVAVGASVTYSATVVETSGSGPLSGTVSFTDNGAAIAGCQNLALVSGKASCSVHFTTGGTFTIAATYANDANFSGSSSSLSQVVGSKPVFTSTSYVSVAVGHFFSLQVTATGSATITYSLSGPLPHGVTFNAATGVLSGTPASGTTGSYYVTITASNSVGSTSQSFELNVTAH